MALLPSILLKVGKGSAARTGSQTSAGIVAKSQLMLDGKAIDVTLRRNVRAKRIILRMDKHGEGIVLTVPSGTSHSKAMEFAASQGAWIWQQMAKQLDFVKFSAGEIIPVRDIPHRITPHSGRRTPVWIEPSAGDESHANLFVSGDEHHHSRRIRDWLKKQARADLNHSAHSYAQQMGGRISRISIRDTSSRWGSCSSNGALSFSWRQAACK